MSLTINGSFFNTHRMLYQYVKNAYFPGAGVEHAKPSANCC